MFRSPKLLAAARGQDCTLRIPHVCNGNPDTVVAAHSNQLRHGKGGSLKAHDCFVAWACYSCHAEIDQGNKLRYEDKCEIWQRGNEETLLQMFLQGIVKVV